jgi:hypothetical protein
MTTRGRVRDNFFPFFLSLREGAVGSGSRSVVRGIRVRPPNSPSASSNAITSSAASEDIKACSLRKLDQSGSSATVPHDAASSRRQRFHPARRPHPASNRAGGQAQRRLPRVLARIVSAWSCPAAGARPRPSLDRWKQIRLYSTSAWIELSRSVGKWIVIPLCSFSLD